ncbi:unnamed protein product [Leptidea sinapis]|uniref:THAP-type domain-containing protein n=1 Tax=Leptidea sinapis TaxID=189913 RepID=A0A5E4R4H5_9NEOP|nr:unnamed protein product [Leptidea sinapis]
MLICKYITYIPLYIYILPGGEGKRQKEQENKTTDLEDSHIESDMENYMKYKLLGGRKKLKEGVVPHKFECQNPTNEKPERFAKDPKIKEKWIDVTGRKTCFPTKNSTICSFHFANKDFGQTKRIRKLYPDVYPKIDVWSSTLPVDMDNYLEYHLMGTVSQVRMKPGCIPTKFECLSDSKIEISIPIKRPNILKKQRKILIEECQRYSQKFYLQT